MCAKVSEPINARMRALMFAQMCDDYGMAHKSADNAGGCCSKRWTAHRAGNKIADNGRLTEVATKLQTTDGSQSWHKIVDHGGGSANVGHHIELTNFLNEAGSCSA
eukprot:scaffold303897_cov15-Tisochrysis_lutea.AAC.1